jgi:hypothetical protein
MADRGMGIRLFNTREALRQIFEEFELSDSDDGEYPSSKTAVVASQLRHFVIQVETQRCSSSSYLIFTIGIYIVAYAS